MKDGKSTPSSSKKKSSSGNNTPVPTDKGNGGAVEGKFRLVDLLTMAKTECETLSSEHASLKKERDELKKMLEVQLVEANAMKEALTSLKASHEALKGKYEEEFQRLRSQQAKGDMSSGLFGAANGPSFSYQGGVDGEPAAKKQKSEGNVLSPLQKTEETVGAAAAVESAGAPAVGAAAAPAAKAGTIESGTVVKKDGYLLVYNPLVETRFDVSLKASVEHRSVVCCVRFSSDGKYLASGCNKSAQIYDTNDGKYVSSFNVEQTSQDEDAYVRSVCFSPDCSRLAAGAEHKTIKVWNLENKTLLHTLKGHELDIYSLDYANNGKHIISGSGDGTVRLWDAETGSNKHVLTFVPQGAMDGGVTSIAFSPDSSLIAAGSLDRMIRVWDTETGALVHTLAGHDDSVYSVAFSPDGSSLVSGSLDRTLRLWDVNRSSGKCSSTFTGHRDFVLSVAYSPDGKWLVSGSKDRTVQFWDPRSAVTSVLLQGHKNSVISVAVAPKGNLLGTGSGDLQARIWGYDESGTVITKKQ